MEFTKTELYDLIYRPGPVWLVRADVRGAALIGVNLSEAYLGWDDLRRPILIEAHLSRLT